MNVGFIGLGTIGGPTAIRLADGEHTLTVYDVREERMRPLVDCGAKPAGSAREVAENSEVVFTSLPTLDAVRDVLLHAESGVIAGLSPGGIAVDLSTVSMDLSLETGRAYEEAGLGALDAPVIASAAWKSTGKIGEGGLIALLVGGDEPTYRHVLPVLEKLGERPMYLGPKGTGMAAKLALNYITICTPFLVAEALLFAEAAGVNVTTLAELAPHTPAGSGMFDAAAEWLLERDPGEPGNVNGTLAIMSKDVLVALEEADRLGTAHEMGDAVASLLRESLRRGWDQLRFTVAMRVMEERHVAADRMPER
jgi:2-hydroxy-3-oxopropionate reductase